MVKILYTTRIKVISVNGYTVKVSEEYQYLTIDGDGNIWVWKDGMIGRKFIERLNYFDESMINEIYDISLKE